MREQTYNDQMMIRYLLGALPEEEREKFDELSIVDDDFALRLSDVENNLVDAYVRGGLSADERRRFSSHYLASSRRRTKTHTAQALRMYADKVEEAAPVRPSQVDNAPARPLSQWSFLPAFLSLPRLAFTVAAIVGLIGIGWMGFEILRLRSEVNRVEARRILVERHEKELQEMLDRMRAGNELAQQQRPAESQTATLLAKVVSFKLEAPARGPGQQTSIAIPPGTDYVVLQVELEPDDYPSYNVMLLQRPGNTPAEWKRERVKSKAIGESKVIELRIPANLMKPQGYLLSISGISDRGVADGERHYPFQVVKP